MWHGSWWWFQRNFADCFEKRKGGYYKCVRFQGAEYFENDEDAITLNILLYNSKRCEVA